MKYSWLFLQLGYQKFNTRMINTYYKYYIKLIFVLIKNVLLTFYKIIKK